MAPSKQTRKVGRAANSKKTRRRSTTHPKRQIVCADSLEWLPKHRNLEAIVTSIPEMEEVGKTLKDYEVFFRQAATICLDSVESVGYCIFLQTDRKYRGWISKTYWLTDEAYKRDMHMLWHKIAVTQPPGTANLFRPTYSHMLCFSKTGKPGAKPFPDVVMATKRLYTHGFGIDAVALCLQFLKSRGIKTVVDPFVGAGTTVAIAEGLGMKAIGVDNNKKQCAIAGAQPIINLTIN